MSSILPKGGAFDGQKKFRAGAIWGLTTRAGSGRRFTGGCPLSGVKRTWCRHGPMSANDPKRTFVLYKWRSRAYICAPLCFQPRPNARRCGLCGYGTICRHSWAFMFRIRALGLKQDIQLICRDVRFRRSNCLAVGTHGPLSKSCMGDKFASELKRFK
jgi:hypothetical protein